MLRAIFYCDRLPKYKMPILYFRLKLFHLFTFLLFALNLNSQSLHFESAGLKDMPSSEVYKVFQDSQGFIWLATDAGLCRYDGNSVRTYTVKDGISENVILKIYEDHRHRIWFSTLSGYFFYYENGKFTEIEANKQTKKNFVPFETSSFIIEESDTLLFTGPASEGLMKIPPENNYAQIIHQHTESNKSSRYIHSNKKGTEYVNGGGSKIPLFKDSTYTLYFSDTIISVSFKKINGGYYNRNLYNSTLTKEGTLYIPTRNQLAIIRKGKEIQYHNFPDDVLNILQDKDGDIWVATRNHGGYIFKSGDLNSKPMRFLDTLSVSSIIIDKEENVWATTLEKGIFRCMNKNVLFMPGITTTLANFEDQLILSFASKKISIISTTDSLTYIEPPSYMNKGERLNTVLRNKHSLYYGTSQNLYYTSKNSISVISGDQYSQLITKHLIFIGDDTVLAINFKNIILVLKDKNIKLSRFLVPFSCAIQLANKKILLGSRNNCGIVEFKNNTLRPFLGHLKELKTRINCIEEDQNGNIWIATNEKGIYCYNPSQKKLYAFNEDSGLRSNKVNSCTIDREGNIWCGTQIGVSKLNITNGLYKTTIQNFNENHGIFDLEINAIKEFNGKIYCAGKTALFYFEVSKMQKNHIPPNVYIQSLYVNDQIMPITNVLHLKYSQNNFKIQVKLIAYKTSDNKRFYYKLNGYDKRWDLSNSGDITYTNIKYGTYPLVVYGINNDGTYSSAPQVITFIVEKPFWLTWWFISIEIILLIVIVYFTMRFWKFKIEKKQLEKFQIEQKISEFKMTALRAQMNPHFIFNAINSIQHYILKQDTYKSYNYLAKFSLLIRNILDNSKEEYITISQEINTLKLYIELEQMRFTQPFEFILDIDEELPLDAYIPTMLIQPFVENSIWHGLTPKKTNCILQLILKKDGSNVFVIIRDNGIGRNLGLKGSPSHVSKGTSLTDERLKELTINNNEKFTFSIIDLTDDKGNATGTEVRIKLPIDF